MPNVPVVRQPDVPAVDEQPEKKRRVSKQPPPAEHPEFVSPRQGASIWGVSAWTLRELIRLGLITGKRYGQRRVLVNYQSGQKYFTALPDAKTNRPPPTVRA